MVVRGKAKEKERAKEREKEKEKAKEKAKSGIHVWWVEPDVNIALWVMGPVT